LPGASPETSSVVSPVDHKKEYKFPLRQGVPPEIVKSTEPSLLLEDRASTIILETEIDEGSTNVTRTVSEQPYVFPVTIQEYVPADRAVAVSFV
jgi:hypothetical protein